MSQQTSSDSNSAAPNSAAKVEEMTNKLLGEWRTMEENLSKHPTFKDAQKESKKAHVNLIKSSEPYPNEESCPACRTSLESVEDLPGRLNPSVSSDLLELGGDTVKSFMRVYNTYYHTDLFQLSDNRDTSPEESDHTTEEEDAESESSDSAVKDEGC
ncbi:uncharacterized protein I206_107253 [Kwoniella pini CBS 10737]|uniref:Uncharacterized protein n=1 Tax=Kwoniella pini CBS 10737 TaxID=1296096 RepID=A0A1B9HYU3_9TREE|nr:uncharacterized protein I206_05202 [Kwoniella pini CBS 10737]OCF48424.1 hypothetical protein I206_05202 [Kwoniella pini CBS 10737]